MKHVLILIPDFSEVKHMDEARAYEFIRLHKHLIKKRGYKTRYLKAIKVDWDTYFARVQAHEYKVKHSLKYILNKSKSTK